MNIVLWILYILVGALVWINPFTTHWAEKLQVLESYRWHGNNKEVKTFKYCNFLIIIFIFPWITAIFQQMDESTTNKNHGQK